MSAHPIPPVLRVGETFAERYVVEEQLGTGGMGAVYRVLDTFVGENIALKLAAIDSADPVRAERLWELQRGEVTMARRVAHPHVARVFDLGRHDGIPYLTMAYVPGPTLRGALRAGALTTLDIARLGHDIASALAAAHAAGVLHLDLKPENVVLTGGATPVAVLVDFGIARALGTASSGMGTADYISPEQLERSSLTGAADVFALGCVLHEALSGRHAFTGRSRRERMLARLDADPRALPDDVPAGLAALVRRCLAREPGERPTAAFLERAFAEQGLALDPQSGPSPTSGTSGTLGTSGTSARRVDLGAFGGGLGRRLATARRKLLRMGGEDESLAEIESVLAVEPRLDVGLALRALALVRLWHRSGVHTDAERHALAERAAAAVADAVAAASHLADTHLADALIADYGGDIAYAVRALRRAQTLEPLHAFSHEVLGRIELEGNVGGVDRLLLAHDLDAGQLGALATAAREHFLTGRDDEGEALLAVVEAGQHGRHLDATALRMRLCLWRRDRAQARRLQLLVGPPGLVALRVLQAGLGVLIGETSVDALIEAAADAAQRTASPKRKSHIHQLAAEALAAVAPDEAIRHLVSCARQPLSDLRWLDACPALDPLRGSLAFVEARGVVQQRVDRAFAVERVVEAVRFRSAQGAPLGSQPQFVALDTVTVQPMGSSQAPTGTLVDLDDDGDDDDAAAAATRRVRSAKPNR